MYLPPALADGVRLHRRRPKFLRPRLKTLSDPFLLPQMDLAVTRLLRALDGKERVVLFGDYDVDGVTSLALLARVLRAYGGAPELFLPLRMEEGYGLSRESVERCLEQHHPRLLVAIDCGTSSVKEIEELKRCGVDVIVLDHHEPKSALPEVCRSCEPEDGRKISVSLPVQCRDRVQALPRSLENAAGNGFRPQVATRSRRLGNGGGYRPAQRRETERWCNEALSRLHVPPSLGLKG